jgi:hypothetical protein
MAGQIQHRCPGRQFHLQGNRAIGTGVMLAKQCVELDEDAQGQYTGRNPL